MKIDIDLSNLLVPTGTIEVEQVRIAGSGFPFGDLCIRKDEANAVVGGFTMNLLTGEQIVDFPFATVANSTAIDAIFAALGRPPGEVATLSAPTGLAFPVDLAAFAPLIEQGEWDGVLTLPVALEQTFEVVPGLLGFDAVVDLVLGSSANPPTFSDPALVAYCEPRWAKQGEPLSYVINPKSTYLHYANEAKMHDPLIIDLADVGAVPGDTLNIITEGRWDGLFQGNQRRVAAVFSSSDVLLPVRAPVYINVNFWAWLGFHSNRVPGAIEAGPNVVTPLTFAHWNRTDIPQDFEVTGSRQMVVPTGAQYLFLSPIDVAFSDNISSSLRVGVSVE